MQNCTLKILAICGWLFFGRVLLAKTVSFDPHSVRFSASCSRAQARAGESVGLELIAKYPKEINFVIVSPGQSITTSGMRLTDSGEEKTREGTQEVRRLWFKLVADLSGSYIIPALTGTYVDPNSKKKIVLKTPEIFLDITGAVEKNPQEKDGAAGPRDIKGTIKTSFRKIYMYAAGVLGLLALLGFGVWFWWRLRAKRAEAKKLIPLLPHQEALAGFNQVLGEQKDLRRSYFELSLVLRTYLERRFNFLAAEMTLEEIRRHLQPHPEIHADMKKAVLQILERADAVKFAGMSESFEHRDELVRQAMSWVNATTPAGLERGTGTGTGQSMGQNDEEFL